MTETIALMLAVLVALLFKHFLFDFVFQRPYQFLNKGIYGHPGGILHAGLHAAGTIPALQPLERRRGSIWPTKTTQRPDLGGSRWI